MCILSFHGCCVVGTFQDAGVIQAAYQLNVPLQTTSVNHVSTATSYVSIDSPAVILETIKKVMSSKYTTTT